MKTPSDSSSSSSSSSSDEDSYVREKKQRRREQNRRAAQRHKAKIRQQAVSVVEDYKKIMSANTSVRHEVRELLKEKEFLEKILSHHVKYDACCLQSMADNVHVHTNKSSPTIRESRREQTKLPHRLGHISGNHLERVIISGLEQTCHPDAVTTTTADIGDLLSLGTRPVSFSPSDTTLSPSSVTSAIDAGLRDSTTGPITSRLALRCQSSSQRQPSRGPIPAIVDLVEYTHNEDQGRSAARTWTITKTEERRSSEQSDIFSSWLAPKISRVSPSTTADSYFEPNIEDCSVSPWPKPGRPRAVDVDKSHAGTRTMSMEMSRSLLNGVASSVKVVDEVSYKNGLLKMSEINDSNSSYPNL